MKKIFFALVLFLAAAVSLSAAEKKAADQAELKKNADKWTFFQVAFLPNVPSAQMYSNVYGIKSGWPVTCGFGTVYGLEASWFYSGTEHFKGIQSSWLSASATIMSCNREVPIPSFPETGQAGK